MRTYEYTLELAKLHGNTWPVTARGQRVGHLTEHVTVALDGGEQPHTDWSWTLYLDDRQEAVGPTVTSRRRFESWREALDRLAQVHDGFAVMS